MAEDAYDAMLTESEELSAARSCCCQQSELPAMYLGLVRAEISTVAANVDAGDGPQVTGAAIEAFPDRHPGCTVFVGPSIGVTSGVHLWPRRVVQMSGGGAGDRHRQRGPPGERTARKHGGTWTD